VRRESEEEESLWSEWIGDVVTGTEYDVEVMDSTKRIKNNDSNGTECKHVVDVAKETKEVEYKTCEVKEWSMEIQSADPVLCIKVRSISSSGKSVTGGGMEDVMELERSGCTYLDRPRRWKEEE
jgi:hypothetical protein